MKYRLFCVLMLLGLISSSGRLRAQVFEPFNPYGDLTPSVNSWSMIKYGGITPSLYTGAMSWSLPLYTYSDPDFNIPVSLEYNYDGFRPATPSGEVGLGWALNCGGVITREVRGVPDEQDPSNYDSDAFPAALYGYYHTVHNSELMTHRNDPYSPSSRYRLTNNKIRAGIDMENTLEFDKIEISNYRNSSIMDPFSDLPSYEGKYESTPDLFHFNVMGLSGDFILTPDASIKVLNATVPAGTLNIEIMEVDDFQYDHMVMTIKITDAEGTQYVFGGSVNALEYSESASSDNYNNLYSQDETLSITAIKLSQIIAPNGRTATFHYSDSTRTTTSGIPTRNSYVKHYEYYPQVVPYCYVGNGPSIDTFPSQSVQRQYYSPLKSITIDGRTALSFQYLPRRYNEFDMAYFNNSQIEDMISFTVDFPCGTSARLAGIQAINESNKVVESISLSQGFSQGGTPKMFLDSLSIRSAGSFRFQYINRDNLPKNDTDSTDYWGFWNEHPIQFTDLNINSQSLYNQFIDPLIKTPSFQRTKKGALNSIIYPTGGYSVIEYESNQADRLIESSLSDSPHLINASEAYPVGGLRVSSITDCTDSSSDTTRFTYFGGILLQIPDYFLSFSHSYVYKMRKLPPHGIFDYYVSLLHYRFSIGSPANLPRSNYISYESTHTIHPDRSITETVFTDYVTDSDHYLVEGCDSIRYTDKNIYYERDTQYNANCTSMHDYYTWTQPWSDQSKTINGFCSTISSDYSACRGLVTSIKQYDAAGQLRKKEENTYSRDSVYTTDWMWFNDISKFYAIRREIYRPLLMEKKVTFYEGDEAIIIREVYTYNSRGQLVTKETIHPEATTEALHLQYCHTSGLSNPSGLENLLSDIVKTRSEGNQKWITSAERYTYDSLGCKLPTKIQSKIFESPMNVSSLNVSDYFSVTPSSTRISTFSYNGKQRLTHAALPGGATIDYTWDPAGKYVLTKSVNGPDNVTIFDWKDLVGLTQVTDPSGQVERYEYDARNRPWKAFDSDSLTVSVYYYKLKNE